MSKAKKIEVTKVEVEIIIDGTTHKLTREEAVELRERR